MKTIYTILLLYCTTFSFACVCDTPALSLEYMTSKFVFYGEVLRKEYAPDKLTYTATFRVIEHFKEGHQPIFLKFNLMAEGDHTGKFSSCDWNVEEGQKWVIFAEDDQGDLSFSYYCSNSFPIRDNTYPSKIKELANNWKDFSLGDFIFTRLDYPFEETLPELNLDSLLRKYYTKDYGDDYNNNRAHFIVDMDSQGKVIQVSPSYIPGRERIWVYEKHPVFKLNVYHPLKEIGATTEFQKDILRELLKIRKWEPAILSETSIAVPYRRHLQFHKRKDTILAHYK